MPAGMLAALLAALVWHARLAALVGHVSLAALVAAERQKQEKPRGVLKHIISSISEKWPTIAEK